MPDRYAVTTVYSHCPRCGWRLDTSGRNCTECGWWPGQPAQFAQRDSWICSRCKRSNAPHIDRCICEPGDVRL